MSDETKRLEKILRGELAAVTTYEQALDHLSGDGRTARDLRGILADHRQAVSTLRRLVAGAGGSADQDPGTWGAFAKAVESAGATLGRYPLLLALKEGEQHGASEYRTALASGELGASAAMAVRERLLPAQEKHIARIDALTAGSGAEAV